MIDQNFGESNQVKIPLIQDSYLCAVRDIISIIFVLVEAFFKMSAPSRQSRMDLNTISLITRSLSEEAMKIESSFNSKNLEMTWSPKYRNPPGWSHPFEPSLPFELYNSTQNDYTDFVGFLIITAAASDLDFDSATSNNQCHRNTKSSMIFLSTSKLCLWLSAISSLVISICFSNAIGWATSGNTLKDHLPKAGQMVRLKRVKVPTINLIIYLIMLLQASQVWLWSIKAGSFWMDKSGYYSNPASYLKSLERFAYCSINQLIFQIQSRESHLEESWVVRPNQTQSWFFFGQRFKSDQKSKLYFKYNEIAK